MRNARTRSGSPPRVERGPSASPGRLCAAQALLSVERGGHVEDALAERAPRNPTDRGQAWFLALGVLRRLGDVDTALRPHLRQPIQSLDPEIRVALRLGAFERLFARTPPHAIVHQGVEVARRLGAGRASGLVNAVLRRVQPVEPHPAANHPAWIATRWRQRYGEAAAFAWMAKNDEPAAVAVVSRARDAALGERLTAAGHPAEPAVLRDRPLDGVFWLRGGASVLEVPGFAEGELWVQDPSSVGVADLVAANAGDRVLDACAAPGGKTFRLASTGAKVLSVDLDPNRLQLLRDNAARLHLPVEVRAHDWTTGPLPGAPTFDAVLVDAPCTGLGTLRRHPEIRWRRQLVDLFDMPEKQTKILVNAASHVRPGGTLVYAVCSPEPEEGRRVVEAFLAEHADFQLDAELDTAPPLGDEDAHYAARLRRR